VSSAGVIERESRFRGADGLELFARSWRPAAPRGVVVLVHGIGDHSGLYPFLVEHLVARGWAVHAFDQRGNGRSPGRRGHVERWALFRDDLAVFVDRVTRAVRAGSVFLVGNSLGGLLVLDYALARPEGLAGVVAVAPALSLAGVPRALLLLGRIASVVWPGLSLETGLDLDGIARDRDIARLILGDPLFHRRATARLSTETAAAIDCVLARANHIRVPTLLLHGGDDRMVPPAGTRAFARRAPPALVEYREYPAAFHALLADLDREAPLADLERWLGERSSPQPARPQRNVMRGVDNP
jgi:alpha-beta hydrolase superfamily lysophospholipase